MTPSGSRPLPYPQPEKRTFGLPHRANFPVTGSGCMVSPGRTPDRCLRPSARAGGRLRPCQHPARHGYSSRQSLPARVPSGGLSARIPASGRRCFRNRNTIYSRLPLRSLMKWRRQPSRHAATGRFFACVSPPPSCRREAASISARRSSWSFVKSPTAPTQKMMRQRSAAGRCEPL
jgi:hypothetical protein